jgi:RimJ/RimL family protein N-acetyltransferase
MIIEIPSLTAHHRGFYLTSTSSNSQDVPELVKNLNDPNVADRLASPPYPYTKEDGEWFLNMTREENAKHKLPVFFCIRERSIEGGEGKLIGHIGLELLPTPDPSLREEMSLRAAFIVVVGHLLDNFADFQPEHDVINWVMIQEDSYILQLYAAQQKYFHQMRLNDKPLRTALGVIADARKSEVMKEKAKIVATVWEIGYWLSSPYWGLGIMSRAVNSLLQNSGELLKGSKVQAQALVVNKGSQKVLQRAGLEYVRGDKTFMKSTGRDEDCLVFERDFDEMVWNSTGNDPSISLAEATPTCPT